MNYAGLARMKVNLEKLNDLVTVYSDRGMSGKFTSWKKRDFPSLVIGILYDDDKHRELFGFNGEHTTGVDEAEAASMAMLKMGELVAAGRVRKE